jgi:hypothetical protein
MRRKLIKFEVFEDMKNKSLSTVVNELVEAEAHLARTIGANSLTLESFDESNAVYQKDDGTFVKANYSVDRDSITFDNLEELVIDEASEKAASQQLISQMLEAILEENDVQANTLFEKYMELASTKYRREGTLLDDDKLEEGYVRIYGGARSKNGRPKLFHRTGSIDEKKSKAARLGHKRHKSSYQKGGRKRHANVVSERNRRKGYKTSYGILHNLSGGKQYNRGKKHMNECLTLASNVFGYADYLENGYVLAESVVRTAENGDVVSVRIPDTKSRNEGKILKQQYAHMIKQDSPKIMREAALKLHQNPSFARAVAELKRQNNVSDNDALEETLNKLVGEFPAVLYLTQEELAKSIGTALESLGQSNFDDERCGFMAEGILRVAHNIYNDKVEKIVSMAKPTTTLESEDSYLVFQNVVKDYYPSLDEETRIRMKVFEDLYNAVIDMRQIALEAKSETVKNDAQAFISELEIILKGQAEPDVDLAVEVADWLNEIAESNLAGAGDWSVVKDPYHTVTGDHPQMGKNAKQSGAPGEYPGDWDDPAPMVGQDSMAYSKKNSEEARNRSWGNKGGSDVWPSLENPNIPKPFGNYTMKEPNAANSGDSDWSRWQSSDTWPGLQNPYCPKAMIPKQKVDPSNRVD